MPRLFVLELSYFVRMSPDSLSRENTEIPQKYF